VSPIPHARGGSYPLRGGNAVRPLVDGEPAFRAIARAIEAARASVWATIAFVDREVRFPDGRGTVFDVLDDAVARGLDVRVLFWREPELARLLPGSSHFGGAADDRAWLRARQSRFLARWDHLPRYCHHQKSWMIDAGEAGETAFVGGINLDQGSMVSPGHPPTGHADNIHDLYVALRGPAATDVHHNFVQRWNEASERDQPDGCWPQCGDALPFPDRLSPPAGEATVQITRTVRPGRYRDATPPPGASPYAIAEGERSVAEQYLAAIDAAERTIYLENQFVMSPETLTHLDAALGRGIEVVFLVPAVPMAQFRAARADGRSAAFFAQLAALARHANFTLAGLAAWRAPGCYEDIYVHAKAALVDDAWATIGSTNIANRSFFGDTELNASFWHADTVRALRCDLLAEHLAIDTTAADDRAALRLYREIAQANRERRRQGGSLQGLAFAIDPATYGA
jgi:phosphatidylserine/phosphatidylglycerophosphate/cardiolipin synthase-like enzyme